MKSIVDPWRWVLEGTNVLFYPSLIVLAGSLVRRAFLRRTSSPSTTAAAVGADGRRGTDSALAVASRVRAWCASLTPAQ